MKQDLTHCGSYHCQGGHHWIFEGTDGQRLNSMNCGAHRVYDESVMVELNNIEDVFNGYHEVWGRL